MQGEKHIVSIVTVNVTDADFAKVAASAAATLERRLPNLKGFIEGKVLSDEHNTRIVVMTEWASRESWAKAEWDQEIERTVADLYEVTASYDLKFLYPLAAVKGTSA